MGSRTHRFDTDAVCQVVNNVVVVEQQESSDLVFVFVGPPNEIGQGRGTVQTGKNSLPFLFLVRSVQPQIS